MFLYVWASAAAIGVADRSTPSANASAYILEAPKPLLAKFASTNFCAPLAHAGNSLP